MKILIYTPVFYPSIGGMETVAECMAEVLTRKGHEVRLITPLSSTEQDQFPFKVYRNPGIFTKIKLISWSDIVYSNGATLAILPLAKLLFKPYIWKHAGYQASCIDGLGWVNGKAAPMTPWASVKYHFNNSGFIYTLKGALKLLLRRISAKYIVSKNIAITNWVAKRQPFPNQVQIYNPAPLGKFIDANHATLPQYHFVYLGRLVSEKGLKDLIHAFAILSEREDGRRLKLLIIGDGNLKGELEVLAAQLKVKEQITFTGNKKGEELKTLIHSAEIAVVPSEWEEPMGIVALELLAAGRNIIVSDNGGLKECIGEAGLSFPNGDVQALAACMEKLLNDNELKNKHKLLAKEQIKKFDPDKLVDQYLQIFNSIIKK